MHHKARWMAQPGPGFEVGRRSDVDEERCWYDREQREKAALVRRVDVGTVQELERIQRTLERENRSTGVARILQMAASHAFGRATKAGTRFVQRPG